MFTRLIKIFTPLLVLCALSITAMGEARGEGWHTQITEYNFEPSDFLVVDKKAQKLYVLQKHSPLSISASYSCTTGQADGDKQTSGDLRTPEGVYFVDQQLSSLDFDEYGGRAYTLNYPNPVDRLRDKSGHGIWLHSKGHDIIPKETKGCIALNLKDLDTVGKDLVSGYPVAVADEVDQNVIQNEQQAATASLLKNKVTDWVRFWSSRSEKMFSLYDSASYTKAQPEESFTDLKTTKERLFKSLPWIHTLAAEIRMMPGPGYWVTWFNQFYRAPNLETEGIRRLYWQQNEKGEWLIVGMEWIPKDLGMSARYLETVEPELTSVIENWREAWEKGDAEKYASFYAPDAVQGNQRGQAAIKSYKQEIWHKAKPKKVVLNGIRIATSSNGIQADMEQIYEDKSGYKDKGIKTITLRPVGNSWAITGEDWRSASK